MKKMARRQVSEEFFTNPTVLKKKKKKSAQGIKPDKTARERLTHFMLIFMKYKRGIEEFLNVSCEEQ